MGIGKASILKRPRQLVRNVLRKKYYTYLYPHFDNMEETGVGRLITGWERRNWMGDNPAGKESWDTQYKEGKWDLLLADSQLEKTAVILGYIRSHTQSPAILDVGCGNGVVLNSLSASDYSKYTGVDISEQAINRLRERQTDDQELHVANAETVHFDEPFDVVILNESLYYLDKPIDQFKRFLGMLNDDGIIILSTYGLSQRAMAIFKRIRKLYHPANEVKVSRQDQYWMCSVFSKSGSVRQ